MIYDVNTFDDIIKLPIRPQAQFYMKAVTFNVTGGARASNVRYEYINLDHIFIAPNPNDLTAARLSENGYKVDDPNLRIFNNLNYCNLMFSSQLLTDDTVSRELLYGIQHPFDTSMRMAIKIGPLYKGSFRFDWIEYDGQTETVISTQSATLTATEDYETLEFDVNPTSTNTGYKLIATALDADAIDCTINFDAPKVVGSSEYIISNANLIKYTSNEQADLYSQSRNDFEYSVEFLDADHSYDPKNPKGGYDNLILGSSYHIYTGYNINGLFVDAYSSDWITGKHLCFLKDLPVWDNEKVTLHLADAHTFNSNLTTQIPYVVRNQGLTLKPFFKSPVGVSGGVLSTMFYYIRCKAGPYTHYEAVNMRIADNDKKVIETTGYLQGDNLIEEVYTLCQNALGCWNYGDNVEDISVDNVKDYTIDKSVIYDQGLFISKEPLLKTLTVKKYINTRSDTPLTYTATLQASDFKPDSPWPYKAELKIDNPLTNIADISVTKSSTSGWSWDVKYETDNTSGLCRCVIYIYTNLPNVGAGTYTVNVYPVDTKVEDVSEVVNDEGENLTIDNPFITSDELVTLCATTAKQIASWREVYDIDVMENFKLRVGDIIKLDTQYEQGISVIITGLQFNIPGPKGHITCRRIS